MIKSWINGEVEQGISVQDRGLLYGDGFFTTIAVDGTSAFLLDLHLQRIAYSSKKLQIPVSLEEIKKSLQLFLKDCPEKGQFILKIIITRGQGARGYRFEPNSGKSSVIFQLFDYKDCVSLRNKRSKGLRVSFCENRISKQNQLAGVKHLNRLENVLLASEKHLFEFDEAFVFDNDDYLVEGLMSNIFILKGTSLKTPLLDKAGVEGVMKSWLQLQLVQTEYAVEEVRLLKDDILNADAVFFTNCILGVCKVSEIDQCDWQPNEVSLNAILNVLDLTQASF